MKYEKEGKESNERQNVDRSSYSEHLKHIHVRGVCFRLDPPTAKRKEQNNMACVAKHHRWALSYSEDVLAKNLLGTSRG